MRKSVDVEVDRSSWGAPVPASIASMPTGPYSFDVDSALLYLAWVTRPPMVSGFSLADTWAFLRYLPAIAANPELRLCALWTDVDAHQKSILSDDFGVAFSALYLATHLRFVNFHETRYYARAVAPETVRLVSESRRGPKKAPDFVAIDGLNRPSVIECKGTQSTRAMLVSSLSGGKKQKRAAVRSGGFHHSLVAGLFVGASGFVGGLFTEQKLG